MEFNRDILRLTLSIITEGNYWIDFISDNKIQLKNCKSPQINRIISINDFINKATKFDVMVINEYEKQVELFKKRNGEDLLSNLMQDSENIVKHNVKKKKGSEINE